MRNSEFGVHKVRWSSWAAQTIIEQQRSHRLGVLDSAVFNHRQRFLPSDNERLDLFSRLQLRRAGAQPGCHEQVRPFVENAGDMSSSVNGSSRAAV